MFPGRILSTTFFTGANSFPRATDGTERGGSGLGQLHNPKESPFIVIRIAERALRQKIEDYESLSAFASAMGLPALQDVLDRYGLQAARPLIQSVPPSKLLEMEARARRSALPPLRSLTSYWLADMRRDIERIEQALKALNSLPEVEIAYRQVLGGDPVVNPANDPYNGTQNYLDAAPDGIDARWAWTQPNGEGAGIRVIDMEQGWLPGHQDFATKAPTVIAGDNRDGVGSYIGNHGTAVLGEMIADDNTVGVVGIAPSAGPVNCASHYDAATASDSHVANAVAGALNILGPGDILVIEFQTVTPIFGAPAEFADDNFDALRLASALGIVVVEAAGNGTQNLDTLTNGGAQILNPASGDFRESGAIIVGAALSALPHNRAGFSSFGARVNCYGWGENVTTCGYGDLDNGGGNGNLRYTDTFSGTSSATPIVAGAALIVQGMHEANTGVRLSPAQMRAILSNAATGTAQGAGVAGNIGVMPNLRAIIEDTLGLSPDVYLRDNISDDGTVPASGSISASPDIIARPTSVADGTASFGEGSGSENDASLGYVVESGQDNFIYVRMKNRGGSDANGVTARIFWSEVSTLVTPDMWNLIGTTTPVNVPMGDTLVVAPPLTWVSAGIPATGHYCFVGILDHAADPAPVIPAPTDWTGFQNFIRNQNNVTWRNFNVEDNAGADAADPYAAAFLIANAPDRRRYFDFVIQQRLAPGVKAVIEVPIAILKPFIEGLDVKYKIDKKRGTALIQLPRIQRLTVPRVLLPAKARLDCKLHISGLSKPRTAGSTISVGQHFEGTEVGRVTWRFVGRRGEARASS